MTLSSRLAILAEITVLSRLGRDPEAAPGGPREREFLVRQAGALDRQTDADDIPPDLVAEQVHDATEYALMLLAYDRDHDATGGVVPAEDSRWDEDPRGYARQEHAVWMRDLR
jgi:hypothetical protein